jgi:small membrane protein
MIAQLIFTAVLIGVTLVAFAQLPQIPLVGSVVICAALFGGYILWVPDHANYLANLVGIGRGADLLLYVWVLISCAILLLLYLNLREQAQLITALARRMALAETTRGEAPRRVRRSTPAK